ncbi:MAG: hypothetical protein INF72_07365 [Roseomonas sp.]|nr:hypothetical protein [Roseomonas sp.]MCA3346821.1 hypothetical protein [Roseomonas sp.]MCA3372322.1 hypothetical protein [Roseomonas sp.]MCA3384941.1 hypothetical protein [Roseomonas sp.]MCA3399003.1 hypothetical protein [Roseomonas sp.]
MAVGAQSSRGSRKRLRELQCWHASESRWFTGHALTLLLVLSPRTVKLFHKILLCLNEIISGIGEVVAAFAWADDEDECAKLSPSFFDGAWLCSAYDVLELGEELLDWVEIGIGAHPCGSPQPSTELDPGNTPIRQS